jgi:hypothetical protein
MSGHTRFGGHMVQVSLQHPASQLSAVKQADN